MPSPVWPLAICLVSWALHSRFLCNIALYSIRPCVYHQSHPKLGIVFALFPSIHSWVISPLMSSSILGTYQPREFLFQCPVFCLFILFMGFSRQEYWSGLPFSSPADHVLSELSSMTRPSWVALHSMALSFIELDKTVVHVISLVSLLRLWFSLSAFWWMRIRGLWEFPEGRD